MSNTTIPYHLRQNKAVDRYAFIELLAKLDRVSPINKYRYIGFGGHSLEEFKYLHDRFNLSKMTSIESNIHVAQRQKFNQPCSCIDLVNKTSGDFLDTYNREDPTIIWLDYTTPKELKQQVEEFQQVIQKLDEYDIIKITLNTHASSYHKAEDDTNTSHKSIRFDKLKTILGEEELFPLNDISVEMMTGNQFPYALLLVLKYAANLVLDRQNICFQPLTCFSYADGQTMMTVTGVILRNSEVDVFLKNTGLIDWELKNTDWSKPRSINIPDFTIRERLYIDRLLPKATASEIQKELGFQFGTDVESLKMLENYIMFYRQSPYFSRVVV